MTTQTQTLSPFHLALDEGRTLAAASGLDGSYLDHSRPHAAVRPDVLDRLEEGTATLADLAAFLWADGGAAPCCPFGSDPSSFVPAILAHVLIMADGSGDLPTADHLDGSASSIVNAGDGPDGLHVLLSGEHVLARYGVTLADIVDLPTWALDEARQAGKLAGESAATWATDGNTDEAHARRVLAMLDDGDPAADAYLPARPNLSGEWADSPTPASVAADVLASEWAPVEWVDELASAWEDEAGEAFTDGVESAYRAAANLDGED